jgi:hypothetical protein
MIRALAAIELSGTTLIDLGAVGLTTLIIFFFIGPKLWKELRVDTGGED